LVQTLHPLTKVLHPAPEDELLEHSEKLVSLQLEEVVVVAALQTLQELLQVPQLVLVPQLVREAFQQLFDFVLAR
jgi:hypothetical protein